MTSFAAAVGGYGCFLLVDGVAGILAGTVAIGLGMSWNGVLTSRFMDAFPAADRSAGFGLVRAMFILLGSLGSVVTGILADEFGWPTAYGLVMGLLCVAMVALAVAAVVDHDLWTPPTAVVGRRTKGCRSLPRTTLTCTTQL